jgi:hyperosmotically inducible protein
MENRIEALLEADAALKSYDIDVQVDGSVATLTGTVATSAQKDEAARLAQVTGISRVDNKLRVDASTAGRDGVDRAAGAVGRAAEKTGSAISTAGDKAKQGVQKATGEVTDAYLLSVVKAKFVGVDVLQGSDINVDADAQVVTLKGTVVSEAGRKRAIELAKDTDGVKRVVDQLTIAPAGR